MAKVIIINPANGQKVAEYPRISKKAALKKIAEAKNTFEEWKNTGFKQRAKCLNNLADIFEKNRDTYALLATTEMGKIIGQAKKEVEKCALVCRYYAKNAEKLLADEPVKTEAYKSYITFPPLGVILAVMPWNFPFYQVIRFAAPALMAGNTVVIKHASNVQGCALALEDAFKKAGFPSACLSNLNVGSELVKPLIEDKNIVAVTLTGSEAAGRAVASIAGQNLKKTILELGGSDAYIILDDADVEEATELATFGRLQNNGQTCIAAKRFIVLEKVYHKFLKSFTKKMRAAVMGNPLSESTYYGPLARIDLRKELHAQVQKTIKQGAQLVIGGVIPKGEGAFYPATILTGVKPGMEAFDNEMFGPVAAVIKAANEKEAVELANKSTFGLGAGVITSNKKRGEKIALQLEAGSSFVNKLVRSDPRLPFGGIKNSGYGRELSGLGIKEFVNTKTIWIN